MAAAAAEQPAKCSRRGRWKGGLDETVLALLPPTPRQSPPLRGSRRVGAVSARGARDPGAIKGRAHAKNVQQCVASLSLVAQGRGSGGGAAWEVAKRSRVSAVARMSEATAVKTLVENSNIIGEDEDGIAEVEIPEGGWKVKERYVDGAGDEYNTTCALFYDDEDFKDGKENPDILAMQSLMYDESTAAERAENWKVGVLTQRRLRRNVSRAECYSERQRLRVYCL